MMTNNKLAKWKLKSSAIAKQTKSIKEASGRDFFLGLALFLLAFAFVTPSIANTPAAHTDNNKDATLKGSGRVNPSTLAMEINIPLGNYAGRGIDVPVSLSYSSKLWRFEMVGQEELTHGVNCYSIYNAVYSEKSASGWTSSLDAPYIEYTGWENAFDAKGMPLGDELCYQNYLNTGDPPSNTAELIKRITVHLPSGGSHELREDDTKHSYDRSDPQPSKNGTYYSVDGSNLKFVRSGSSGTLYMPDGSFYNFTNDVATKYTDRNGNNTNYNSSTDTWTDTLGRTLTAPFEPKPPTSPTTASSPQVYNIPGFNGGDITYKLHWKKLDGGTQTESALTDISDPDYDLKYAGDYYGTHGSWDDRHDDPNGPGALFNSYTGTGGRLVDNSNQLFNPVVLTEIELPTGQSYKFSYDIYGRIEKITYPTGGTEEFTYNTIPGLSMTVQPDVHEQANFGVTNRVLSESTGGSSYTWNYSASQVSPLGYKITEENPDGTEVHRYLHRSNDPNYGADEGSYGYDNGLTGMAYKIATFDRNDQPVSQTLTHWTKTTFTVDEEAEADWHPRVTHTDTYIYDPNDVTKYIVSTTKFEYEDEASLNQRDTPVLKKKTLQFGYESSSSGYTSIPPIDPTDLPDPNPTPVPTPVPANLVRSSEVTYLINDTSILQTERDIYKNKNMIGLTTESIVKDGSGTIVSKSEMKYDESGYSPAIGRGNPTTLRVYVDTGEITGTSPFIDTRAKFDANGNQTERTDALGRTTITEYDSIHNAFAVKVTTPIPDPSGTNGSDTAFVAETTYDITASNGKFTGLPLTKKDVNGEITTFEYDTVTLRPTKVIPPNGGSIVKAIYDDVNRKVTNKVQINASSWTENITHYDGLGRTYKTEQVHSDGNIFVEKEFYSNGKVKQVSNPYRTGEAKSWTTYVYDDAGRLIEVELPDQSKVSTEYAISDIGIIGTTKQITDQAGKKRKGINDVLGRMVRVIEDPDGQAFSTDYVFDTLGNLRETIQGEQHRYFMHDSLGRLLYTKQPEEKANSSFTATDSITNNASWSNKYVYDDDGNLVSTTNARNVTITATYDDFNRIIMRDYDDDTPDVSYYYDGKGLGGVPSFSKGKTTKVTSSVSETRYTEFDNLGRLLKHEQITQGNTYPTEYTYNLSGATLTETYPSGRVMTYDYRQDGELDKVSGVRSANSAIKTYLSDISYNTLGNIEKIKLGNGNWESVEYNNRQQISQITLGYFDGDNSLLEISYEYKSTPTSNDNNGSLRQQKINYAGLTNEIVQGYTYDDLNRLKVATETSNASQTWKQTFNYDRFGNRTFDEDNTTTLVQNVANKITNPTIQTSDNRLTEDQDSDSVIDYDYDKSGNITLDAENKRFVYDAENRIKEFFRAGNNSQDADATYEYDGDGKRVRKLVEETNGTTETVFVYNAGGQLVAEYSNQMPTSPKTSYLTEDHLGSPRIITDDDKDVVSRHDYLAFGDEVSETVGNVAGRTNGHGYGEDDDIRKQYTGYERDQESGLDFAQARYYNSQLGRFTSVDPLTASASIRNPQTFNRYSYVLNSPYKFVDPLGLVSQNTAACGSSCKNDPKEDFGIDGIFTGNNLSGMQPQEDYVIYATISVTATTARMIDGNLAVDITVLTTTITYSAFVRDENGSLGEVANPPAGVVPQSSSTTSVKLEDVKGKSPYSKAQKGVIRGVVRDLMSVADKMGVPRRIALALGITEGFLGTGAIAKANIDKKTGKPYPHKLPEVNPMQLSKACRTCPSRAKAGIKNRKFNIEGAMKEFLAQAGYKRNKGDLKKTASGFGGEGAAPSQKGYGGKFMKNYNRTDYAKGSRVVCHRNCR